MPTSFEYTKTPFGAEALRRALPQALTDILQDFTYNESDGNKLTVNFTQDLTAQEEIDLQAAVDAVDATSIQWETVRGLRDQLCNDFIWRVQRWQRRDRLAQSQTDDLADLDSYMDALANITVTESDPFNITWPIEP